MTALSRLMVPNHFAAQWLDLLQPLLALATRLHVGWVFFKSGLHKIGDWEQTIALFENESPRSRFEHSKKSLAATRSPPCIDMRRTARS